MALESSFERLQPVHHVPIVEALVARVGNDELMLVGVLLYDSPPDEEHFREVEKTFNAAIAQKLKAR